jgi:hypothetical protein
MFGCGISVEQRVNIVVASYTMGKWLVNTAPVFSSKIIKVIKAVAWLRRLVVGLPPRRPGFDLGSVHVGFLVDNVTLEQVFPRIL